MKLREFIEWGMALEHLFFKDTNNDESMLEEMMEKEHEILRLKKELKDLKEKPTV